MGDMSARIDAIFEEHLQAGDGPAVYGTEEAAAVIEALITLEVSKARAVAFDDAAAILRMQHKHGTKCETEAEWLQASYTFSNEAYRVRLAAGLPTDTPTP